MESALVVHYAHRIPLVEVLGILGETQTELLEIALAGGAACIFSGSGKDGKEDSGEDCYDRDDDQKLNKGETDFAASRISTVKDAVLHVYSYINFSAALRADVERQYF